MGAGLHGRQTTANFHFARTPSLNPPHFATVACSLQPSTARHKAAPPAKCATVTALAPLFAFTVGSGAIPSVRLHRGQRRYAFCSPSLWAAAPSSPFAFAVGSGAVSWWGRRRHPSNTENEQNGYLAPAGARPDRGLSTAREPSTFSFIWLGLGVYAYVMTLVGLLLAGRILGRPDLME